MVLQQPGVLLLNLQLSFSKLMQAQLKGMDELA